MKRNFRRLGALSLALLLCLFCLTGCSFDMRSLLGMSDEEDEEEGLEDEDETDDTEDDFFEKDDEEDE